MHECKGVTNSDRAGAATDKDGADVNAADRGTQKAVSARKILDEYEQRLYQMYKEKYEYGSTD